MRETIKRDSKERLLKETIKRDYEGRPLRDTIKREILLWRAILLCRERYYYGRISRETIEGDY